MVIHQIDTVNSMSIFFSKREFNSKFYFRIEFFESKNDEIIAMSIHFKNFPWISRLYTNSTSKMIIYCFKSITIKVSNLCIFNSIFESELNIRLIWWSSIIELSEGNNLSDNDGFSMILFGLITWPKIIILYHLNSEIN